jgi:hypothetical protein
MSSLERVLFAGVSVVLPDGWQDVTADLPPGSPFTLGRQDDALGALQFSIAEFKSGAEPHVSLDRLKVMMEEFFQRRKLGRPQEIVSWMLNNIGVSGDCISGGCFYRIWYITDKVNVGFITYVTSEVGDVRLPCELAEADMIVRSIQWPAAN